MTRDDEECGHLSHYQGENYVRCAAFLWSHLSSFSPQTQSGIQLLTKACDEAKKLSDDHSVARKTPNLSSFGQKKNFNGIISIFLWHHCLGVKDLLYGEC